jgi:hypothetical protein
MYLFYKEVLWGEGDMKVQTNVKAGVRDLTVNVNNTVTVNVTVGSSVTITDNSVNTPAAA